MSETDAATKGRPAVFGVSDEALDELSDLTIDVSDLSEGLLSDIVCTLVGLETTKGGEERESKTTPGEYYTTQDQMIWHLKVHDAFERGLENEIVQWYFNLPRAVEKDGRRARAQAGTNSDYGVLLKALEGLGFSANAANAVHYQFTNMRDLVGLVFRRQTRQVEQRNGSKRPQDQITEIFGIDNDARTAVSLPPVYIKGQEPQLAAAGSKK